MKTEHTPTPWAANEWATGWTVSAPDSHYSVCHLAGCNNAAENAAFIVRAVNTHDELVARLEQALQYIEHPDVRSIPFALSVDVIARHTREALAKAKGI